MSVFDSPENVGHYEAWFESNPAVFESEVMAIREVLPGGIGFEIGIGTGLFAEKLGIRMGNDPSGEMLKIARKRNRLVYCCKGDDLPFHDGYFDYTLMVTTLCFLDDPVAVLRECRRVTRRNGAAVVAFIDGESATGKSYRNRALRSPFYRDAVFYSADQVRKVLAQAGFAVESVRQTLFGPLTAITEVQHSREGVGEGAFVVMRAMSEFRSRY
ncbi:MAG: class I SAM-dependent methyltransferase [Chitinispirillaceae bacterium]|nr:class I SAM-dependent methyltransferase [Chitinispirillaceae bacterium]